MTSRYYDEKDDDIRPGRISAELRTALNLAENDVPIWIYRMRALGYPPGWLSKAIVDTSDIFDTDPEPTSGKRKGAPDAEGPQYDHSKLIEYPGFNTPLPPNTQDYHYYYNMPPMLPHQQLDYAKKTMSAFKPVPTPPHKRSRSSTGSEQAKESNKSRNDTAEDESGSGDSSGEEDEDDDDNSPESPEEEGTTNGSNDKTNTSKLSDKSQDKSKITANQSSTSLNSTLSEGIKLVSKGSPMPKPVDRLPLERFSEGVVGELLYFENIPNSTGKFDSIRGLLNTMRQSRSSDTDQSFGGESSATTSTGNKKDN